MKLHNQDRQQGRLLCYWYRGTPPVVDTFCTTVPWTLMFENPAKRHGATRQDAATKIGPGVRYIAVGHVASPTDAATLVRCFMVHRLDGRCLPASVQLPSSFHQLLPVSNWQQT